MSKKITRSTEVALDYSRYEEICHSEKSIASRDISLDEVTSHPGTLQQIVAVHREIDGEDGFLPGTQAERRTAGGSAGHLVTNSLPINGIILGCYEARSKT